MTTGRPELAELLRRCYPLLRSRPVTVAPGPEADIEFGELFAAAQSEVEALRQEIRSVLQADGLDVAPGAA